MGIGYAFRCKKCGKEFRVGLGIGFFGPTSCDVVEMILDGIYGSEWQQIAAENEFTVADADIRLFRCDSCGYWDTMSDLSLYKPKDLKEILTRVYGSKTVKEWGCVPYASRRELEENYDLLAARIHLCECCGGQMSSVDDVSSTMLQCKNCGSSMGDPAPYYWD